MFENLVTSLLTRLLGNYIKPSCFQPDRLNVGVWSGYVVLKELELKDDVLNREKSDLEILRGFLGTMEIKIPWNRIRSESIVITLDDVYLSLQVNPLSEEARKPPRTKAEEFDIKKILIEKMYAERKSMKDQQIEEDTGFTTKLLNTIIDNLEFHVRRIHIRVEDYVTGDHPYALGLTVESGHVQSADSSWTARYVPSSSGLLGAIYKLIELNHLSVYLDPKGDIRGKFGNTWKQATFEEIATEFSAAIPKRSNDEVASLGTQHHFLLNPTDVISRLRINKDVLDTSLAAYELEVIVQDVAFALEQSQYCDILYFLSAISQRSEKRKYHRFRPRSSVMSKPREWWYFAGRSILHQVHERRKVWTWKYLKRRRDERIKYMGLWIRKRAMDLGLCEDVEIEETLEAHSDTERLPFKSRSELGDSTLNSPRLSEGNRSLRTDNGEYDYDSNIIMEKMDEEGRYYPLLKEEEEVLLRIERHRTVDDILFFRYLADAEFTKNRMEAESANASGSSWINWIFGSQLSFKTDSSQQDTNANSSSTSSSTTSSSENIAEVEKKELYAALGYDPNANVHTKTSKKKTMPEDYVAFKINLVLTQGSITLASDTDSSLHLKHRVLSPKNIKYSEQYCPSNFLKGVFERLKIAIVMREESFKVDISLGSVEAWDHCVLNSAFSRLLAPKAKDPTLDMIRRRRRPLASPSTSTSNSTSSNKKEGVVDYVFLMSYETNPAESRLAHASLLLHMEPLEIVYSPTSKCWKKMAAFVNTPEALGLWAEKEVAALNDFVSLKARTEAKLEYAMANRIALAVDIRIQAPVLVVPESDTDVSCARLVMDLGYLSLNTEYLCALDTQPLNTNAWASPMLTYQATEPSFRSGESGKNDGSDVSPWNKEFYDRYSLRLTKMQVLLTPRGEGDAWRSSQNVSKQDMFLLDRFDINVALSCSVLPLDATLNRCFVRGDLPALNFHLSIQKYERLRRMVEAFTKVLAAATDEDDEDEDDEDYIHPLESLQMSTASRSNAGEIEMKHPKPLETNCYFNHQSVVGQDFKRWDENEDEDSGESEETWFSIPASLEITDHHTQLETLNTQLREKRLLKLDLMRQREQLLSSGGGVDVDETNYCEADLARCMGQIEGLEREKADVLAKISKNVSQTWSKEWYAGRADSPRLTSTRTSSLIDRGFQPQRIAKPLKKINRRIVECTFTFPMISIHFSKPKKTELPALPSRQNSGALLFDESPLESITGRCLDITLSLSAQSFSTSVSASLKHLHVENKCQVSPKGPDYLLYSSSSSTQPPFTHPIFVSRGESWRAPEHFDGREKAMLSEPVSTDTNATEAAVPPPPFVSMSFITRTTSCPAFEGHGVKLSLALKSLHLYFDQAKCLNLFHSFQLDTLNAATKRRADVTSTPVACATPTTPTTPIVSPIATAASAAAAAAAAAATVKMPILELSPSLAHNAVTDAANLTESVRNDLKRARERFLKKRTRHPASPYSISASSSAQAKPDHGLPMHLSVQMDCFSVSFSDSDRLCASAAILRVSLLSTIQGQFVTMSGQMGDLNVFDLHDDTHPNTKDKQQGHETFYACLRKVFGVQEGRTENMIDFKTRLHPGAPTQVDVCMNFAQLICSAPFACAMMEYVASGKKQWHAMSKRREMKDKRVCLNEENMNQVVESMDMKGISIASQKSVASGKKRSRRGIGGLETCDNEIVSTWSIEVVCTISNPRWVMPVHYERSLDDVSLAAALHRWDQEAIVGNIQSIQILYGITEHGKTEFDNVPNRKSRMAHELDVKVSACGVSLNHPNNALRILDDLDIQMKAIFPISNAGHLCPSTLAFTPKWWKLKRAGMAPLPCSSSLDSSSSSNSPFSSPDMLGLSSHVGVQLSPLRFTISEVTLALIRDVWESNLSRLTHAMDDWKANETTSESLKKKKNNLSWHNTERMKRIGKTWFYLEVEEVSMDVWTAQVDRSNIFRTPVNQLYKMIVFERSHTGPFFPVARFSIFRISWTVCVLRNHLEQVDGSVHAVTLLDTSLSRQNYYTQALGPKPTTGSMHDQKETSTSSCSSQFRASYARRCLTEPCISHSMDIKLESMVLLLLPEFFMDVEYAMLSFQATLRNGRCNRASDDVDGDLQAQTLSPPAKERNVWGVKSRSSSNVSDESSISTNDLPANESYARSVGSPRMENSPFASPVYSSKRLDSVDHSWDLELPGIANEVVHAISLSCSVDDPQIWVLPDSVQSTEGIACSCSLALKLNIPNVRAVLERSTTTQVSSNSGEELISMEATWRDLRVFVHHPLNQQTRKAERGLIVPFLVTLNYTSANHGANVIRHQVNAKIGRISTIFSYRDLPLSVAVARRVEAFGNQASALFKLETRSYYSMPKKVPSNENEDHPVNAMLNEVFLVTRSNANEVGHGSPALVDNLPMERSFSGVDGIKPSRLDDIALKPQEDAKDATLRSFFQLSATEWRMDVAFDGIHALVVNNMFGQESPVIKFAVDAFPLELQSTPERLTGMFEINCEAFYHNLRLVLWEPLLEPWSMQVRLEKSLGNGHGNGNVRGVAEGMGSGRMKCMHVDRPIRFTVASDTILNVNVTEAFIQNIGTASRAWRWAQHKGEQPAIVGEDFSQYWIKNQTGTLLRYWCNDSSHYECASGHQQALVDLGSSYTSPSSLLPSSSHLLSLAFVCTQPDGEEIWRPFSQLHVERIGSRSITLVRDDRSERLRTQDGANSTTTSPASSDSSTLLPTFESSSSSISASSISASSISSSSISSASSSSSSSLSYHSRAQCLVDVVVRHGVKLLCIRSPLEVTNQTGVPMLVELALPLRVPSPSLSHAANSNSLPRRVVWSGLVPKGETVAIPVHLASLASLLFMLRPHLYSTDVEKPGTPLAMYDRQTVPLPLKASMSGESESDVKLLTFPLLLPTLLTAPFVCSAQVSTRFTTSQVASKGTKRNYVRVVSLGAPLILNNLLADTLEYRIREVKQKSALEEENIIHTLEPVVYQTGEVACGQNVSWHASLWTSAMEISIRMTRFDWSEVIYLPPVSMRKDGITLSDALRPSSFHVALPDVQGSILFVHGEIEVVNPACRKVTLYTPYWIINHTGMKLEFEHDPKVIGSEYMTHSRFLAGQPIISTELRLLREKQRRQKAALKESKKHRNLPMRKGRHRILPSMPVVLGLPELLSTSSHLVSSANVNQPTRMAKAMAMAHGKGDAHPPPPPSHPPLAPVFVLHASFANRKTARGRVRVRLGPTTTSCTVKEGLVLDEATPWSHAFGMDMAGTTGVVEIREQDRRGGRSINLGVSIRMATGLFARTKVISITPRFMIVNALNRMLECGQTGFLSSRSVRCDVNDMKGSTLCLEPWGESPFHWPHSNRRRLLHVRFVAYGWLWSGGFSLEDIGDFALRLRNRHTHAVYLLRVEIKFDASCLVVYFREETPKVPPYRVENYSLETLRFQQKDVLVSEVLLPYHTCAYAWDEPTRERTLAVHLVPAGSLENNGRSKPIGLFSLDQMGPLPNAVNNTLKIELIADGPTRVLRFTDARVKSSPPPLTPTPSTSSLGSVSALAFSPFDSEASQQTLFPEKIPQFDVVLLLKGMGISLIDSKPSELLYVSLSGISLAIARSRLSERNMNNTTAASSQTMDRYEMQIANFQIDNQLPLTPFPVLLNFSLKSREVLSTRESSFMLHPNNVLHICLIRQNDYVGIDFIRYFSLLALPINLNIDYVVTSQLLAMFFDCANNFESTQTELHGEDFVLTPEAQDKMAKKDYHHSIEQGLGVFRSYEQNVVDKQAVGGMEDIRMEGCSSVEDTAGKDTNARSQVAVHKEERKLYFEELHIHPIMALVSFSMGNSISRVHQSSTIANLSQGALLPFHSVIRSIGSTMSNIENAPIQLNALVLTHSFAPPDALVSQIWSHYRSQALRQAYLVLGSADFLGNPVRVLRNFSVGVKDFFYEPAQGLVRSPQEFGVGIAKGTMSLLRNSLYGMFDFTTRISATIALGLTNATLQLDSYTGYSPASGALEGLAQGITGLIVSPMNGLEMDGWKGFTRGLSAGILGFVIKPVAGVFRIAFLTSAALRHSMDPRKKSSLRRVRPPRYFDARTRKLTVFSFLESVGDELISRVRFGKYRSDGYIGHIDADEMIIVVTKQRLLYLHNDDPYCAVEWEVEARDLVLVDVEGLSMTLIFLPPVPNIRCVPIRGYGRWILRSHQVELRSSNQLEHLIHMIEAMKHDSPVKIFRTPPPHIK